MQNVNMIPEERFAEMINRLEGLGMFEELEVIEDVKAIADADAQAGFLKATNPAMGKEQLNYTRIQFALAVVQIARTGSKTGPKRPRTKPKKKKKK